MKILSRGTVEKKKKKERLISHFNRSFSSDMMAAKGLICMVTDRGSTNLLVALAA